MRPLSILQTSIINSIRNHPGIGSTALAVAIGRDRRQINKAALRLVELGHCSVRRTDAGDFFSVKGVVSAPPRAVKMKAPEANGGRAKREAPGTESPALGGGSMSVAADLHTNRPVPHVDQIRPKEGVSARLVTDTEVWPRADEPIEAAFRVVPETSNSVPARQPFVGSVVHQSPASPVSGIPSPASRGMPSSKGFAARGYKRPQAAALGSALVTYDPSGTLLRQQSARIVELENEKSEREDEAARRVPPPIDMVQATARMALDAMMAWGSIVRPADPPESRHRPPVSRRDDWAAPYGEPAPAPAPAAVAAPPVAAVPFWRRRRREEPPVKKSLWF